MNLGGSRNNNASCATACDFFCTSNWRVEKDENGCEVWRYDVREPPPENAVDCPGARPKDAGSDAADTGGQDAGADAD